MVELLLSSRADPNVADHEGNTPLMLAVNEGRAGVLRLLLRHGADTEARATGGPFEGCTALEIARQQLAERDACVQLLSSWRVGEEPPPASRPPSALARAAHRGSGRGARRRRRGSRSRLDEESEASRSSPCVLRPCGGRGGDT